MGVNFINEDAIIAPTAGCFNDSSIGYSADFTVNGEVDGWTYYDGIHTYGAWGGFLFGTLFADHGTIGRYNVFQAVDADTHYFLRLTMKYNPAERKGIHILPTRGKIRWVTLSSPTYDSNKEKYFDLSADNKWHTYLINMGVEKYWIGDINNLRLWLPVENGADGDEFFIRKIELVSIDSYKCRNLSCDKYAEYTHPCPWVGKRASITSAAHEDDKRFNIESHEELIININGYGNEIVKIDEVLNGSGQEVANKIARAISRVDIGGYAEVQVVYSDDNKFEIYSGTTTEDSSVEIIDNTLSRYLKFFSFNGSILSTISNGELPANGYIPVSSFNVKTYQVLSLFDNNEETGINFNPLNYSVEGGRQDWIASSTGVTKVAAGGGVLDDYELEISRTYFYLFNDGRTVIDFNHPFNASGRIKKIYASCTLDMYFGKDRYEGNTDPNNGDLRGRRYSELQDAKIMIFRPRRDGTLDVVYEFDMRNRDRYRGIGDELYAVNQESIELDVDVFVNKGDLLGVYNANMYVGKSVSGYEIDAQYFQVSGKPTSNFNPGYLNGDGSGGILIYARSDERQTRLLLDLDLRNRYNIESIEITGESKSQLLEYNIARCLDINWQCELFDEYHWTRHTKATEPGEFWYQRYNVYFGLDKLNDGIKIVNNGLACDGFSLTTNNSSLYWNYNAGPGVVPINPYYFWINGDEEWLAIWLHAEWFQGQQVVLEFSEDPIAIYLHFPFGKEKQIYKSIIYFKEKYNFRSFGLSTYGGDGYNLGDADDVHYDLIPEYTAITLDQVRHEPGSPLYDQVDKYIFKNPCNGAPEIILNNDLIMEWDKVLSDVIRDYSDQSGYFTYQTGYINNQEEWRQSLRTDWATIEHEWEPISCRGFRIFTDFHKSTKICEIELYGVAEDIGSSFAGSLTVNYSDYNDIWWPTESVQESEELVEVYIGDSPRYFSIDIAPITETRYDDIKFNVKREDLYVGDKGCQYVHLLENSKKGATNKSQVINLKNVYQNKYDLYVDIAPDKLLESGLTFFCKMNDEDSITNPLIGPDAIYYKLTDYAIVNQDYNCAINCYTYGLRNLIEGRTAYYSYDDMTTWHEFGQLASDQIIDFHNLDGTSRTYIILPDWPPIRYWKLGFLSPDPSMNIREARFFDGNFEQYIDIPVYHDLDKTFEEGHVNYPAPHTENQSVTGSYYELAHDQYITADLGSNYNKLRAIELVHDGINDYTQHHVNGDIVAGIDHYTRLYVLPTKDLSGFYLKDYSYYEHDLVLEGTAQVVDGNSYTTIENIITTNDSEWEEWHFLTDYADARLTTSGVTSATFSGGGDTLYFNLPIEDHSEDGAYRFLIDGNNFDTSPVLPKIWHDVSFDMTFKLDLAHWYGGRSLAVGFTTEINAPFWPSTDLTSYKVGATVYLDPSLFRLGISTRINNLEAGYGGTYNNNMPDAIEKKTAQTTISGADNFIDLYSPLSDLVSTNSTSTLPTNHLIDGYNLSYWEEGNRYQLPIWLSIDTTTSGIVASKYKLSAGNTDLDYMPKTWQFQGSHNDLDWDILDSVSSEPTWTNYETRTYTFSGTVGYRYYRLYITDTYQTYDYLRIYELDILDSSDNSIIPRDNSAWLTASHGADTAYRAVDSSDGSYWNTGVYTVDVPPPYWLKYDFGSGNEKVIKMYSVRSLYPYSPSEWLFQGSNNNSNWTTLDQQRYQYFTSSVSMCYPADNDVAYRYYRILFLKTSYTGTSHYYFYIHDWKLFESRPESYYIRFSSEGSKVHRDHIEALPDDPSNPHNINYTAQIWYDSIDGAQLAGEVSLASDIRWAADKFGLMSGVNLYDSNNIPLSISGSLSELNVEIDYESHNCPFDEDLIEPGQYTAVRVPDGQSNYIKVPHTSDLDFENRRHTIDFWVKFNTLPTPGRRIYMLETSNSIASWAVAIYNTGSRYRLEWWVNGSLREYTGQDSNYHTIPYCYFMTHRWYYILFGTGKGNTIQGFTRGAFLDLNGRLEYDDAPYFASNTILNIPAGYDMCIGKNMDGWVSSIRVSTDYDDTVNTSYGYGGSRATDANSFGDYGLIGLQGDRLPVPYKPYEKLYTFSFYVSPDNNVFGHRADVDAYGENSYSYFEIGSKFAEKYNAYFAIDLGDQHKLDIVRHYGQQSLYYFDDISNTIYSSVDTADPNEAFTTQFAPDPDDDFLGWDSFLPDKDKWEIFGISTNKANYIRLRNGYLELKANSTEPGPHGIKSKYAINGDFDIEVKFGRTAPDQGNWYNNFGVKLNSGSSGETSMVMTVEFDFSNPSPWYYIRSTITNNGTADTHIAHIPALTTRLRIVRESHHFYCYYYYLGSWIILGEALVSDARGKDVDYIFMSTETSNNYPSIANYFYEYKVNSADALYLRSDSNNTRWLAINLLNGDFTDRYIYKMGLYPDITQNIAPGGNGYNCEWDNLGPSVTAYSEGSNVALGATASGSSYISVLEPSKAVDGITSDLPGNEFTNVWATDNASEQWLWLDFGEEKNIYRVKMYHGYNEEDEDYMIEDYYIEVSTDNENYTTIFNITNNSSFERTHDLVEPVAARYLRLYITSYKSKLRNIRDRSQSDIVEFTRFKGAVLRQIEVYSYYGYSVISSEEYPIIAINLRDQFYIYGHSLTGIFAENDTYDWDNDDAYFAWSDSVFQDPQKVKFGEFGGDAIYEQWLAIRRNTASYYNPDPPLGNPPSEPGIDYLKHVLIESVDKPNPTDYPWWWEADISTISRDYDKPVELSTSSIRIDYPASTALDHVRFREGTNFGIDLDMARRDGVAFRFYIEDIDKFDTSEGYFYWGGVDGTPQENEVEYRWYWSTFSGSTGLQTGWNRPYFRFRTADEVLYTPLVDPTGSIDPLMREYMTMKKAGLKFRGVGEPLTLNVDGFAIQRNHFNDYSRFSQGLYLAGNDYFTAPLGEINFSAGTIEFWLRPDFNFNGLDEFHRYRNRSIFHFANVINDMFGMLINANGINIYYGNLTEELDALIVQGLSGTAIDGLWHFGIVFSNTGTKIGDNSTIRVYINNYLVASNYSTWEIKENKSWKFSLGGKVPLALIQFASSLITTSVEGVISDLKIYNYCKTDFSDSLQNIPDEARIDNPYLPSKLIEISDDNVTFYRVGAAGLPFILL